MLLQPVTAPEAARMLGLSANRVRAMAVSGQLAAFKIGDRWLFERSAVEARRRQGGARGRPFEPHNAWALLFLTSGREVPGADPSVRWRLRRSLDAAGLEGLAPRLARRAEEHRRLAVHQGELPHLLDDPAFVTTGISAAAGAGIDLSSGHEADGYVAAGDLERVVERHAMMPGSGPPAVRVRVVPDAVWRRFLDGATRAPDAAVALDLAEDLDPRSVVAAKHKLAELAGRA